MDAVTLSAANAFARSLPRSSPLAALTGRLRRALEDLVLVILGDSTGNDTTEWVYLTAQWLAARFPAYTILLRLWNDANQNYDAAVTLQTGTSGRTLTIYNASTPGMAANYSTARLAAQVPVSPTAVLVSYAHNSAGTTARPDNYPLIRALREKYPFAPVTLIAQNPRAATDAGYANGLARQQSVIDLAQSEGLGLINVLGAFLANPNYATDWLLGDGLHPNVAGSQRWAQEVQKHLAADGSTVVPTMANADVARIFVPAVQFVAKFGTPTRIDANDPAPVWSLPATGTSTLQAIVDVPPSWDWVNLYALWMQVSSSGFGVGTNNAIIVQTRVKGMGVSDYAAAASAPQNAPVVGWYTVSAASTLASNNTAAGAKKTTYLGVDKVISFGHGSPLTLEITRLGDNAGDNNADAWLFMGVELVRQS